jgi:hypothetical protein
MGEAEICQRIYSEFNDALQSQQRNINRSFRNWQIYSGVDEGQAEADLLLELRNEDRHYEQFNIATPKVETLTGALASEKFDLDLKPIEGKKNSLTEACKASWYADKGLCHYDKSVTDCIKAGLVIAGDIKMKMSNRYDSKKNICFDLVPNGFLLRDPYWLTDDDRDCEKAWEVFHLSAPQIARKYPSARSALLEEALKLYQRFGGKYDEYDPDFYEQMQMGFKGHLYRVIEYHYIEHVHTERLIGQILDSKRWIPFPVTKDHDILEAYMIKNNIDPMSIPPPHAYDDKIHKLMTIAPEIVQNKLLDGKARVSSVQPQRLPYYHFTVDRTFGVDKGIIDDIYDLQRALNRREMKLSDIIDSADGGGGVYSEDVWDTPEKKAELKRNKSNPRYSVFADGDEIARGKLVEHLTSNQYNPAIIDQIARFWDVIDRISRVPAAMAAMSESANESGVLYDRKLEVARMGILTLVERVKELRKNLFEGYYTQWQVADSYNQMEREFTSLDGKVSTVLNERVLDHVDGRVYVQNRPSMIPRSAVIITESRSNPTRLLQRRALYSELFDRAVQTNPEAASTLFEELMKTMDLDEEGQAKMRRFSMLQTIRDYKRLEAEIATLDSTTQQAILTKMQAEFAIDQMAGGQAPAEEVPVSRVPEEEIPKPVQRETLPSPEEAQNVLVPA